MLRTIKPKQIKVLRRNKRNLKTLNAIQRGVNVLPEQTVSLVMQANQHITAEENRIHDPLQHIRPPPSEDSTDQVPPFQIEVNVAY